MIYLNCEQSELLKVISQEEMDFVSTVRIPYGSHAGQWAKKHLIDERIAQAIEAGQIKQIEREPVGQSRAGFYAQSDYVPGGEIMSMADGKTYDSKSTYYKSLKAQGLHIMDEKPKERKREIESDLTGRDIKNAIERLKSR
jgi:hypothetical protein